MLQSATATTARPRQHKPLAGVRVLDFFWLIAGPLTSRILSDLGAEVIKVESSNRMDRIRVGGPRRPGDAHLDASGVFADCNSGKRCITLNLNTPAGIDLARRLVAVSDIVTNNFTGDRMDRWGLGYDELARINPAVIAVTMPVMGTTGPWRRYGAYGNGIAAAAGFNALMGFPGRPPTGLGSLYPDFTNPFHAATAIFAALHYRNRTGRGQFLDIGQYQANVSLLDTELLDYAANGVSPGPSGNRSPHACPHGVYRCRGEDAWCVVEVIDDARWQTLCAVIGRSDLAADPALRTLAGRKAQEDRIDQAVEAWTAARDRWDVMDTLQCAGIAVGVVETLDDMLHRDPHLRDHFQQVSHPSGYEFTVHRLPVRLNGTPVPAEPHPSMGQDNARIYTDLLGLSDDQVQHLTRDGVLA